MNNHDAIVQRLQAIHPFSIQQIDPAGNPQPWALITGPGIIPDLVVNPHTLRDQIDSVAALIAHWGRLVAQTRRIWQAHERHYRHWRSQVELKCLREGIEGLDKKPSQAAIESFYRTLPEYTVFQVAIEDAEEAHNATTAIFEAFKEKAAVLRKDVRLGSDGSVTRYSP